MKRFRHPFFALLLALLLIGSQQAAFAHLLSHMRSGAEAVTQYQDDHGATDRLGENCTTCIAFAGIGGSAPPCSLVVSVADHAPDSHLLPAATPVFSRSFVAHLARGPPVVL